MSMEIDRSNLLLVFLLIAVCHVLLDNARVLRWLRVCRHRPVRWFVRNRHRLAISLTVFGFSLEVIGHTAQVAQRITPTVQVVAVDNGVGVNVADRAYLPKGRFES
jgi:hypothetical protein